MCPMSATGKRAGDLVRAWRLDLGMSPEQLSWAIDVKGCGPVSGRTIRWIEKGRVPHPRVMLSVARFFDVKPTYLWGSPKDRAAAMGVAA